MQGRRSALHMAVADQTRATLGGWLRRQKTPGGLAKRAHAMFLLAEGQTFAATARQVGLRERHVRKWALRIVAQGIEGWSDQKRPGRRPVFPPAVALYVVKLAGERPDVAGRSLSPWDSAELARQLVRHGVVAAISPQTVQRILAHHTLQPWRHHRWLSPHVPRDAAFAAPVQELVTLYTRPLGVWEMVVCVDEKTSLQPRTRKAPTLAAQPGLPVRVEHEYTRKGALNLLAGFETRTGKVYATTASRQRQVECITFVEHLEQEIASTITAIHVVLDNVHMHKGKKVQAWLATHPRLVFHVPPVHCSWMKQVEQWCSILPRKRLQIADVADKQHLAERVMAVVAEWHERAHPFQWSTPSVAKVMATCESSLTQAA
jgi:DDE superfamily endonuclease/homeodomain-containing protein